jgi:hypothetical protein
MILFTPIGLFLERANGTAIPNMNKKEGKTRSAGVRPLKVKFCFKIFLSYYDKKVMNS